MLGVIIWVSRRRNRFEGIKQAYLSLIPLFPVEITLSGQHSISPGWYLVLTWPLVFFPFLVNLQKSCSCLYFGVGESSQTGKEPSVICDGPYYTDFISQARPIQFFITYRLGSSTGHSRGKQIPCPPQHSVCPKLCSCGSEEQFGRSKLVVWNRRGESAKIALSSSANGKTVLSESSHHSNIKATDMSGLNWTQ